jgi:flagellar biosynthesis/type III secretory pathway protein FliH
VTQIAMADCAALRVAVAGTRIPRRAWSEVTDLARVLHEASTVLTEAQETAKSIRERAFAQGYAEGSAQAKAATARYLLEAQHAAQEFVVASQQRIVALSLGILARIAPRLGQSELVSAMVLEALNAVTAEQSLRVYVAPEAVAATEAVLAEWQREHARIDAPRVTADPNLEAFGCVVESELGRIEAGLTAQLAAVRDALTTVVGDPRA